MTHESRDVHFSLCNEPMINKCCGIYVGFQPQAQGILKGDIWQYGASVQDQVDIITRLLSLVLLSWGIRLDLWSEQGIFGAVRTTFSHPCNCSAIRKQPFRLGNPQASSI